MGYKGPENKDIRVDITNRAANKKILDTYIQDPQDRAQLEAKFSDMERDMTQEKEAMRRDIRRELGDLANSIQDKHVENINNFSLEYGNAISGKITLEQMHRRLDAVIAEMQAGRQLATLNMSDASVVLPVQIALIRAGKSMMVDGVMRVGGPTETILKGFQQENGLTVTGKLDQKTLERLTKYLASDWQKEAQQKKEAADEQEIMLDEPSDKLQKAGDAMFDKDDWLQAMRFYKGAAKQAAKYDMKAEDKENPVYAYVAKKFLTEANRILDEAKASSGTNDYKRNEMARAKALLKLIQDADPSSINKLLTEVRREEDKGLHTFDGDTKQLDAAKNELARVTESLAVSLYGKVTKQKDGSPVLDLNGTPVRDGVPVHPEKAEIWEKQKAIWQKKVEDAQKVVDGYDKRITLDASLTGGKLLDAYIRSYVGPLLPDVVPPKRPDDEYVPLPPPVQERPEGVVSIRTFPIDVRSSRPESFGRPLVIIPYGEYLPNDIHAAGAEARDFLQRHLSRDLLHIITTVWNQPNSLPMRYVVKPGDTIASVARNAGTTEAIVRAKVAATGRPFGVDTIISFAPTEIDPHMQAYKSYITIAKPYLDIQAEATTLGLSHAELLQRWRAHAQGRRIRIGSGIYYLNFDR